LPSAPEQISLPGVELTLDSIPCTLYSLVSEQQQDGRWASGQGN
jgi:hypothetical protein